ncbi:TolC family protein, partial [Asticcacaulis sp. W401b]|uniref:TolC family protein n=1 Tax=Asticcacaulis sp. W401b TaxID=3388666 RepID=UPI003970FB32
VGRRLESNRNDIRIVVQQLLYSGGQASAAIDAAEYRIRAGRETLRASEGELLLQVITAYTDVQRDELSLQVRRENLNALERQNEMTEARRVAGEVTRTDTEQAKAQLEAALVQISYAEAQLQASRATYATLVGQNPGSLEALPVLPFLPVSLEEAFDIATENSPELRRAGFTERESRMTANQARAANNMVVSARSSYGTTGELVPYFGRDQDKEFTFSISVTKPLFSGGANDSGYRESLNRNAGDRLRIEAERRNVLQNVRLAWNQVITSERNVAIQKRQLAAAEIAAQGMQEEFRYGQRSTLDVLVAEQNLREAQLALINSNRDVYVAQATLLRQIGYLEAKVVLVGINIYDPSTHLRTVKKSGEVPWEELIRVVDRADAQGPTGVPTTTSRPSRETPELVSAGQGEHLVGQHNIVHSVPNTSSISSEIIGYGS